MKVILMKKRRKSTDSQIQKHWGMINANTMSAIADYCVGRSAADVAKLIGVHGKTVTNHLRAYGIAYAVSGVDQIYGSLGSQLSQRRVIELFNLYAPKDPKQKDVDEFIAEGFDDGEVAKTLAIAWETAERAIKAGIVFEVGPDKDIEIDIPRPWNIEIHAMAGKVRDAASFLNEAKISDLRKEVTWDEIIAAHKEWLFQIERLENLHGETV